MKKVTFLFILAMLLPFISYATNDGVKTYTSGSWKTTPVKVYVGGSWQVPVVKTYLNSVWDTWSGLPTEYYTIPSSRTVTWQGNAGIVGDIPSRTTIYTTLSPRGGSLDDLSNITTAISNCPVGQVVKLNSGTFNISAAFTVKSGIVLRGNGIGITTIKGSQVTTGKYLVRVGGTSSSSFGVSRNITAGVSKGSTVITTSVAHGFSTGNHVIVDQLNNASDDPPVSEVGTNGTCSTCSRSSGTRTLGQITKVKSVPTSTSLELEIPLYWNYDLALTPQVTLFNTGMYTNTGLEDFTLDNSVSGSSNQGSGGGTIGFVGASNSWIKNVEMYGNYQSGLVLNYGAYRCIFRGMKIHRGIPVTAGDGTTSYATSRAYGIQVQMNSSANLFENNQIYQMSTGLITSGPFSGNVFAYNYVTDLYLSALSFNPYYLSFHGAHAFMNLIEGNYHDGRTASDHVWGTKSHNTFFRNKMQIAPNRTGGAWAFDIQYYSRYYNVIGNVIGRNAEVTYILENSSTDSDAIYRFGYNGDGDTGATGNDAAVHTSMIIHANYDTVNDSTIYSDPVHSIANSLYLTGKPAWMDSATNWPPIGPDRTPMYPTGPGAGNGTPF